MKTEQTQQNVRNRPAVPARVPIRFPVNKERRMLPQMWRQLRPELQSLQYAAQEVVCQICWAYQKRPLSDGKQLSALRKRLRALIKELEGLKKSLPSVEDLRVIAEEIRSIHRPLGVPGSASEVLRLLGQDYFASHKEYFEKTGGPDPAEPIEELANRLVNAKDFLDREIRFIKTSTVKSIQKVRPHVWWRGGGIYYLLERIFREASTQPTAQADAHRKIIGVMRKVDDRPLEFDLNSRQSPAIAKAIERMSPEYKRIADKSLYEWHRLPQRKH